MNFGAALSQLRIGIKIRRAAWSPDSNCIYLENGQILMALTRQAWIPLQEDLLAKDWEIVVPPVAGERPQKTKGQPKSVSPT